MRDLTREELTSVSGGEGVILPPIDDGGTPPVEDSDPKRRKGNNGFGNGGDDGVPGGSDFQDVTR